jgi:hypothetical protein
MMEDMLDYLVLPDQSQGIVDANGKPYSRQTHGLTGPAGPSWDVVNMTLDAEGYAKRYRIKATHPSTAPFPGGWPWDISRFNQTIILDWITEQDWNSPRDYKKNVANYNDAGKMVDGKAMFPRMINSDKNISIISILAAQTGYRVYMNCTWDNKTHYLGDNLQVLFGPVQIDHGGTIGLQPTMVHQYFWDGTSNIYQSKEENFYAYRYGWTKWTYNQLNASTGKYALVNVSQRNTLLVQAPPPVEFPCF